MLFAIYMFRTLSLSLSLSLCVRGSTMFLKAAVNMSRLTTTLQNILLGIEQCDILDNIQATIYTV